MGMLVVLRKQIATALMWGFGLGSAAGVGAAGYEYVQYARADSRLETLQEHQAEPVQIIITDDLADNYLEATQRCLFISSGLVMITGICYALRQYEHHRASTP